MRALYKAPNDAKFHHKCSRMRRRLKMTRIFLGCLFHVKGYRWFAPWVRDKLYGEDGE